LRRVQAMTDDALGLPTQGIIVDVRVSTCEQECPQNVV